MSKVTINKVFQSEKETKFGLKVSVGLKIDEDTVTDINGEDVEIKDRYINGWFPKGYDFPFQEGDVVNVLVAVRGDYLDFKLPDNATSGEMSITKRVLRLEKQMKDLTEGKVVKKEVKETEPTMDGEVDVADPDDF